MPGRNLLFFTYAAAIAYRRGLKPLVGGMCETDYSGYPDCRDDTLKAMQLALNLGMERRFVVETPLMWIDKAATWRLAEELGGERLVSLIVEREPELLPRRRERSATNGASGAGAVRRAGCARRAGGAGGREWKKIDLFSNSYHVMVRGHCRAGGRRRGGRRR